jgi:uncharacterized protein DUF559
MEQASHIYCDSPIEKLLYKAYGRVIRRSEGDRTNAWGARAGICAEMLGWYDAIPVKQPYSVLHYHQTDFIWTQFPILDYKADFALARIAYEIEHVDGVPGDEILVKSPIVVVECDGHDFHEKTKEQAARDKSRDRDMLAQGYRVLRFTGSEIHNRAEKCAMEIDAIIRSLTVGIARGGS